ncbi:hypothetical protein ACLUXI_06225 [Bifidobacterium apri]
MPGSRKAVARSMLVTLRYEDTQATMCIPDVLGALLMKIASWRETHQGNRSRHLYDAALLASMIDDPARNSYDSIVAAQAIAAISKHSRNNLPEMTLMIISTRSALNKSRKQRWPSTSFPDCSPCHGTEGRQRSICGSRLRYGDDVERGKLRGDAKAWGTWMLDAGRWAQGANYNAPAAEQGTWRRAA